jgi:periplasmic protein CpxP/Spy
MKKLILSLAILICTVTFAQPKEGKREKLTPEQRVETILKKMTEELTLTQQQQNEIKPILMEQVKKRMQKREEMKATKENDTQTTDEQRADMKKKMIDDQLEMKTKLKSILTPDQLKKLRENRKERMEKEDPRRK